jgi:hypothetical protein
LRRGNVDYWLAALAAGVAAPAAAEAAASAALFAPDAIAAGSEAIGAGVVAAGAGAGAGAASSFLPQAARATAATREANKSDFFIGVLNQRVEQSG